jgi:ribosome-binding ATPase YchF (GTP1/OBG family)
VLKRCPAHMKPTMYVANVSETGFHDNPLLERVQQ